MMRRVPAILAALSLGACVQPPSLSADHCAQRLAVARDLAALHQYGGDMEAHIRSLGPKGACAPQLADYRDMAARLHSVPRLAGDGGREMGIEAGLAELNLTCP